ncbi:GNAT family N-acetyltransferase [Flavobacterium microcysteis]|uniref:GNAT family N-acetyltransferase n=1 Tax=Flavobacterium microcysteis TaxID=2596891 RepID=A0A501Q4Q8_9FLAO|nr:GNAT family N-acetyltransferase [Flavobacterium microcysteis]
MINKEYSIRKAIPSEFDEIGTLMVETYSQLEGFPKPSEQPNYYKLLASVGEFADKPKTELLVAISPEGQIGGAVVYFGDIQYYGSGGIATQEKMASGFRLLAVSPSARGKGIGKLLTEACISKAITDGNSQLIIHTTMAMQTAWKMYEHRGFKRSEDLDFMQGTLAVYGFRLLLR